MATVTSCPKCTEKLRLPDELMGQRVRCPQCANIFEAVDPSKVPAPAVDGQPNLSLDDPATQQAAPRSKPTGAIEMNLSLDDDKPQPAAPPAPKSAPPTPPPSDQPRDRDGNGERESDRDGNDTMRCPVCRRSNQRDSRRCYHCGERLAGGGARSRYPDRDAYDDDHPVRRRRDTEPHRGGVVLAMGIVSLVSLLVFPAIGIPFGIIGWILGSIDLRKMKNNIMDPDGEGMTRAGWICSIIGTFINILPMLLCGGMFLMFYLESSNRPRTTRVWTMPAPTKPINKDPAKGKDGLEMPKNPAAK